jgi:hypothetical protein
VKLIVAVPNDGAGTDFDLGVLPGEPVGFGLACDTDRNHPDQPCGCGRAFTGLISGQATTTAVVEDLPTTREALLAAVWDRWQQVWRSFGMDDAACQQQAQADTDELLALAAGLPLGAPVRRWVRGEQEGIAWSSAEDEAGDDA